MTTHEIDLQALLLEIAPQAIPSLRLFRRNIGVARYKQAPQAPTHLPQPSRRVKFGIKGQCDLYGYFKGGRGIEIELKSKNGKLSKEQEAWCSWCQGWGVRWVALWPFKDETPEKTIERWIERIVRVAVTE
jgi:hypothetical protein